MTKIRTILAVIFALWIGPAAAGVSCSVPFNLQNGTTADASKVMANYNALIACMLNAASSGANSDITSLNGLTTPLGPSSGGSPVFLGGTSSGSSNAYVVSTTIPSGFSLTNQYTVIFAPNFSNTGASTLAVNGQTAKSIFKQTSVGLASLSTGDIQSGQLVVAYYDGTQFEIQTFSSLASLTATGQTISGGANVTAFNGGSQSGGGTFTLNCGNGPLQYITNAGAFTFVAPSSDSSCDVLVINSPTAGTITSSGFVSLTNSGDAYATTNGQKYIFHVERINGTAFNFVKALQ